MSAQIILHPNLNPHADFSPHLTEPASAPPPPPPLPLLSSSSPLLLSPPPPLPRHPFPIIAAGPPTPPLASGRAALPSPSCLATQPSSPSATPSPASNTIAQSNTTAQSNTSREVLVCELCSWW